MEKLANPVTMSRVALSAPDRHDFA